MKLKSLMALMCATVFIFTSCDKDDDYEVPADDEWINSDFADFLMEEGLITDAKTVTPADVAKITKIDCTDKNLTSLRGIEYFTELTVLYCAQNNLTKLDVRKNTKLTELSCGYNNLSTLDVSQNTKLTGLNCNDNNLTKLDVSKNPELTVLWCGVNNLTTLDVSKNTKLTNLYIWDNNLTALDISRNTQLIELWCWYNNLTTLDVSKNTQLKGLNCGTNNLTTLDISRNTQLIYLICGGNPGVYGVFEVKAWFDNSKIPSNFTSDPWTNGRQTVQINYVSF